MFIASIFYENSFLYILSISDLTKEFKISDLAQTTPDLFLKLIITIYQTFY